MDRMSKSTHPSNGGLHDYPSLPVAESPGDALVPASLPNFPLIL